MALRFFSESRWLSECSILANLSRKPPVGSGARGFDADSWGAGYGGDVGRADRYAGG
jgi:hypothetical protein